MSLLIQAAIALALDGTPDEIVCLPEGEHKITATVDGKPKTVTVKVPADRGETIAASLQRAPEDRHKQNVRPWFDFEHKRGVASALPKSLRYEPGKAIDSLKVKAADAEGKVTRLEAEKQNLVKKIKAAEAEAKKVCKERADTLVTISPRTWGWACKEAD
jgi:hypothetical protein